MKAWVLKAVGQPEYIEVPAPELRPGQVLLSVGAAGICGSDIPRIFETGTYHFPTIPGHEFAGTVVDAYSREDRRWIGKRAGVFPLIPCGECFACRDRHYEMCQSYDYLGSRSDGGFAEFVAVPSWNLIELPDAVSMEEAAMAEPAAVALHAVRRLAVQAGDTVALYGLGTIGILITQWLRICGVRHVFAVGHNPGHGELMRRTSSEAYEYRNAAGMEDACDTVAWISASTGGRGADIAIDCAGTPETLTNCINCVRAGGQVLAVGNPKGEMRLEQAVYWKLLRRQIRLTGTWNSTFDHTPEDDWHRVMTEIESGNLKPAELITHRLPPGELRRGLLIARGREEYHNKIMLIHPDSRYVPDDERMGTGL